MTAEQIIEREWRKATGDNGLPVHVELDLPGEVINVWYRCRMYSCACESDDMFYFFDLADPTNRIEFPIPQDYYDLREGE